MIDPVPPGETEAPRHPTASALQPERTPRWCAPLPGANPAPRVARLACANEMPSRAPGLVSESYQKPHYRRIQVDKMRSDRSDPFLSDEGGKRSRGCAAAWRGVARRDAGIAE